jgi:membrane protein DedA with SNARE-associated domain
MGIWESITIFGLIAVFVLMLLNGTICLPPSEIVVVATGVFSFTTKQDPFLCLVTIIAGNFTGNLILYILFRKNGERIKNWFNQKLSKTQLFSKPITYLISWQNFMYSWFAQKGLPLIFLCRFIPIARTLISIPAGTAKVGVFVFTTTTLGGLLIWDTSLFLIGYYAIKNVIDAKIIIAIVLIVVLIFVLVSLHRWTKKQKDNTRETGG